MKEILKSLYLLAFRIRYFLNSIFIKENKNTILFISEFENTLTSIDSRYSSQLYNKLYINKNDSLKSKIKKICKAKYIYLDNYNVLMGYASKKKIKVQVWHAAIAIKKIGFDANTTSTNKRAIKRYQRVYDSYDYFICASEHIKEVFMSSFNQPKEKMLVLGYPKYDTYLNKTFLTDVEKFTIINSEYLEKLNILYIPTFKNNKEDNEKQIDFVNELSSKLSSKYNILYKAHHKVDVDLTKVDANIIYKDLEKFIYLSDIIITDYSSVSIDGIILDKQVIYYTPDLEEYTEQTGLNVLPKDLIGSECKSIDDVIKVIKERKTVKKDMEYKYKPKNIEGGLHKITTSIIKSINK